MSAHHRNAPSLVAAGLRSVRARAGLSLRDAQALTGLSAAYLSRLKRGERHPSPETVHRLARGLGVGVAAILVAELS